MLIEKLKLKDFRGFNNLEINFNNKLLVIIGSNGTGKTTILDSISLQLNHYIGKLKHGVNSFSIEHGFASDDINYFAKFSQIQAVFNIENQSLNYELIRTRFEDRSQYGGDQMDSFLKEYKNNLNAKSNIPILIYYNSDKDLSTTIELKSDYINQLSKHLPQFNCYINACNKKVFSFKDFGIWWRLEEDKENEIRLRSNDSYRHNELEIVRKSQKKFLEILNSDIYEDLGVYRTNPDQRIPPLQNFSISSEGDLFLKKKSEYIKISQLSAGEKILFLIVSDIARRLVIANPTNDDILSTGKGMVLIDELEQHLHPKWQKKIVEALNQTFPSLQFIITTHSPFVIQSLDSSQLFELDNQTDLNPKDQPINKIITEIMNVDNINADDFEKRHKIALQTLEELEVQKGKIDQDDFIKLKEIIDGILESDTNDPVYKAYLKVKKKQTFHEAN